MIEQQLQFEAYGRKIDFWIELDPANTNDQYIMLNFEHGQCYEAELAWVMLRALREGDFAIDAGANIGFFTLMMSQLVGPSGLVFAYEPGSNNLPSLSHNLIRNKIINVQVIEQPLWSEVKEVTFYINSDSRGSNALFDPANWFENVKSQANPMPIQMQATTLDALDVSKERIRLIKIDTEGAEQRILEGAKNLLEKFHPPYILSELNPHGLAQSGCDNESLRAFMRQFGYEMFFIHSGDCLPALVPKETKVIHLNGNVVSNVLFSTLEDVAKAWPEMMN